MPVSPSLTQNLIAHHCSKLRSSISVTHTKSASQETALKLECWRYRVETHTRSLWDSYLTFMWRASPQCCQIVRYAVTLITLFTDLLCYIIILDVFRAVPCSSSGGQIVLLQHLISSLSVSSHSVHQFGLRSRPVHWIVTILDAVTIQFDLLKMSMILLETCRGL